MGVTKRISVLSPTVANQIAAGEVVDRPAAVVKEFLENSLDAGADRITLDIDAGGAGRIRVLDNGEGIAAGELALAFTRHATSKMTIIEDLEDVATFGFRGEALPSIASVSRTTIRSRQAGDVAGRMISVVGGEVTEDREVGCPVGVDIEAAELFFNTPARLKFLKRESTEASHCAEALVRAALMRPDVSFTMRSQGRRVRELPRVERAEERVADLFPKERLIKAEGQTDGVMVTAILGPPERSRAGAGSLYTYVNGRFIRDKGVLRGVVQGFAGTLEHGRYPVGLIAIDMPPGSLDVNVHPQKTEVRFADPGTVFRAVSRVVGEMAARGIWSFAAGGGRAREEGAPYAEPLMQPAPPGETEARLVPPPSCGPSDPRPVPGPPRVPLSTGALGAAVLDRCDSWTRSPSGAAPEGDAVVDPDTHPSASAGELGGRFSALRYLAQAKELFLLFEDESDLVIIDQHAAHERVTYEKLRSALEQGTVASQRLLVSHTVDLGPADADRIMSMASDLARLGLEVARSGPDSVSIQSIPAALSAASPDRLLADMVLAIEEGRRGSRGEMQESVLATMACHGSIRAGRTVDPRETIALLKQLDAIEFAGHCPHGRPVLTRIPWREIRRRLGRG